jgi:predicted ArsR family transcriptional regulator
MSYNNRLPSASNRYPDFPGSRLGAPETSEDAANYIAPLARTHRAMILRYLQEIHPLCRSSEEIGAALGISRWAVRPRCSELYGSERIERSNDRTVNDGGRSVVMWRAVP